MKTIGIVAHSAEGAALCFLTGCREGQLLLGEHMHPTIVLSAIPMGVSLDAWESGDHPTVSKWLIKGIQQVAAAGADFFICPDNTAHIVLEQVAESFPIPGLHIADVVTQKMRAEGRTTAALLGTKWTMNGPVYTAALSRLGLGCLIPNTDDQQEINRAIFDELCQGKFLPDTTARFLRVIDGLREAGADCAILGCTEIPLIVTPENSPLPVLDSTRLLARRAVEIAIADRPLPANGWIPLGV